MTERGFSVSGAQARLLGGELRFDGGTRSAPAPATSGPGGDLDVAFKAQGTLTAEGLREAREPGPLARLGQHASGGTAYAGTLGFRRGVAELTLASSLTRMKEYTTDCGAAADKFAHLLAGLVSLTSPRKGLHADRAGPWPAACTVLTGP